MMEYYAAIKNPVIKIDFVQQKQDYDIGLKEKSRLKIECTKQQPKETG